LKNSWKLKLINPVLAIQTLFKCFRQHYMKTEPTMTLCRHNVRTGQCIQSLCTCPTLNFEHN